MAANTTVTTQAALETQMDLENATGAANPDIQGTPVAAGSVPGNRKVFHASFIVDGVDLDIGDFYDALNGLTGIQVNGERDALSYTRGTYIFNLGPE